MGFCVWDGDELMNEILVLIVLRVGFKDRTTFVKFLFLQEIFG